MSQPRYISASTASVTNAVASRASANVYGPGRAGSALPRREDLGLDHARVAVVDRAHDGDRAAVASRVAHEQLAAGAALGVRSLRDVAAFAAACATVSRSAKPFRRTKRLFGRTKTSTAGPSRTRSAGVGAPVSSELSGETTFSSATLNATKRHARPARRAGPRRSPSRRRSSPACRARRPRPGATRSASASADGMPSITAGTCAFGFGLGLRPRAFCRDLLRWRLRLRCGRRGRVLLDRVQRLDHRHRGARGAGRRRAA